MDTDFPPGILEMSGHDDDVRIMVNDIVDLSSFLSGTAGELVHHDCLGTIEATCSSPLDLGDSPMENAS